MKTWIKYLIGIALGFVAALVLPLNTLQSSAVLTFITDIVIRIGRYILIPLLLFSGMMAVYSLFDAKILLKTSLWTIALIVLSTLLLTLLGFVSILVVHLPRIPITTEKVTEIATIDIQSFIRSVFPNSAFQIFNEGSFLLPCFVFAIVLGAGCCMEHTKLKPVLSLADSLAELFFNIAKVITDALSVGMIAIMCSWTIQFREIIRTGVYNPLIIMLLVVFIILVGIIYPLLTIALCKNGKPLKVLYASIPSFLVSFFSGDTNLTLMMNMRMGKESLGIKQRTNGFVFPLFSIFARGGTALVTIISFVMILRSYSRLQIDSKDMLMILMTAFFLSFALGSIPSGGTFIALTILCTMYGRVMETGYLLLKPAAAIIGSFACLIDTATAMFGCYIVSNNTKTMETRGVN